MGIDGISLWLILLTTFLMPICILCSWKSVTKRVAEFMALFLINSLATAFGVKVAPT